MIAESGQMGAVTVATSMAGRGTDIKLGPGVAELGGLVVVGTERMESQRIDLQIRGRSGRQGRSRNIEVLCVLRRRCHQKFGPEWVHNFTKDYNVDDRVHYQELTGRRYRRLVEKLKEQVIVQAVFTASDIRIR